MQRGPSPTESLLSISISFWDPFCYIWRDSKKLRTTFYCGNGMCMTKNSHHTKSINHSSPTFNSTKRKQMHSRDWTFWKMSCVEPPALQMPITPFRDRASHNGNAPKLRTDPRDGSNKWSTESVGLYIGWVEDRRYIKIRPLSEAMNRGNCAGERESLCSSWGTRYGTCDFEVVAAVFQHPCWEVRSEHEWRDKARDAPVGSCSCNCLDVCYIRAGRGQRVSTCLRRQCSCRSGVRGSIMECGKIWLEVPREQGICSVPENGEGFKGTVEGAEMEVDVRWINFCEAFQISRKPLWRCKSRQWMIQRGPHPISLTNMQPAFSILLCTPSVHVPALFSFTQHWGELLRQVP